MKFLAMVLVVLVVPSAIAQDDESPSAYLCVPDMSTGFLHADGKWQSANFNTSNDKYVLRRSKKGDLRPNSAWVWTEFDSTDVYVPCKEEATDNGFVYCYGIGHHVFVNLEVLKYQAYEQSGYVVTDAKYRGTPYIEIGKCSPL